MMTAERFADDMCAHRSLAQHDLPCPPQLSIESIRRRYAAFVINIVRDDETNELVGIRFLDDSAVGVRGGRWEVAR